MATTLDIIFDQNTIETLWRWPTDSNETFSPEFCGRQVARVAKPRMNSGRGHDRTSDSMIVSSAFLAPPHLIDTDMEIPVILKIAIGAEKMALLEREAAVYEHHLRPLQGNVVPRFHGLYRGRAEARGTRGPRDGMACMILEYCSGHGDYAMIPSDFAHRTKLAAWSLHQAGINHGQLTDSRHVLDLGYQGGVRIVDFSQAVRHDCPCAGKNRHLGGGCYELAAVEGQLARSFR
ncbi:hypothetical protein V5O48_014143 [Marasmius crinis-equi]|uniref:Protein kinase domain-containing protein n=1 Tax=Marasmius crinis-equi TaxID=585013 RepID=A0ABR3EY72_9AGAR